MGYLMRTRKLIEELKGDTNHAWVYEDKIKLESVLKLSKEYPKYLFWIIEGGRNLRGHWPEISTTTANGSTLNVGVDEFFGEKEEPTFDFTSPVKPTFIKDGKEVELKTFNGNKKEELRYGTFFDSNKWRKYKKENNE